MNIVGLDIGGTKTAVVVGNPAGEISWRKQFASLPERGFKAVFAELAGLADEAVAMAKPAAVSVSIGGPLDPFEGVIFSPPNLPGWENIPLKEMLRSRYDLPVYIERDANAGALAELYFGSGRGLRHLIFITMGTGFGAGLICNGRLYRGSSFTAGEAGHIRVAEDGPLCYGKAGSLEGYGSGAGLAGLARMMYPDLWGGGVTAEDLSRAWREGDARAKAVFERAALYLGRGWAVLVDLFNPERIILGGLGMRLTDALVSPAEEIMRREALPAAANACRIVSAELGERIGDISAICAALDQGGFIHKSIS